MHAVELKPAFAIDMSGAMNQTSENESLSIRILCVPDFGVGRMGRDSRCGVRKRHTARERTAGRRDMRFRRFRTFAKT